jgi:hypothetical protein
MFLPLGKNCFALCFADRQSTGSQGLLRCKAKEKVFVALLLFLVKARKSKSKKLLF